MGDGWSPNSKKKPERMAINNASKLAGTEMFCLLVARGSPEGLQRIMPKDFLLRGNL
jgi:hypothetical protein